MNEGVGGSPEPNMAQNWAHPEPHSAAKDAAGTVAADDPGTLMAQAFQAAIDDFAASLGSTEKKVPTLQAQPTPKYLRQAWAIGLGFGGLALLIMIVGLLLGRGQRNRQQAADDARGITAQEALYRDGARADTDSMQPEAMAEATGAPAFPEAAKAQLPDPVAAVRLEASPAGLDATKLNASVREGSPVPMEMILTPFASYDAALVAAVRQRWCDLLANTPFSPRAGRVVLEFHLNDSGRITDLKVKESDADPILALLSQRAVQDPAPYSKWPEDMRRAVARHFREVTFTFHFNYIAASN